MIAQTRNIAPIQTLTPGVIPVADGQVFLFTPDWCGWAMEHLNVHNRPLAINTAERYRRMMERGEWLVTHQGIALSCPPVFVIDGQKRILAVKLAGIAVPMRCRPR